MADKPILLIDGDVIAYKAASAAQQDIHYPELGWIVRGARIADGEAIVENQLFDLKQAFEPSEVIIYLTEITPEFPNWRNAIYPDYKVNRADLDRPQLVPLLREYLKETHKAFSLPGLEADDLLGIKATHIRSRGKCIICTNDKDLRTIPGRLHILGKTDKAGKPIVETITEADAKKWHMAQTLAGDRVDNFAGCPGMGMTRALRLLENPVVLHPEDGIITRGINKGKRTTKWFSQPTKDMWACVVSHYVKAGLGEEEALMNARVSRILQWGDWDNKKQKVRLWEPYG